MPAKLKKLLICDDDPDMRTLIAAMAQGRYEVIEAADGFAALDLARAAPPDLALVDLVMPGIDGLETLRRLLRQVPGLPVTILTGTTDIEAARLSLTLGAHAFVTKPITGTAEEFWTLVDPISRTDMDKPWRVVDPHQE